MALQQRSGVVITRKRAYYRDSAVPAGLAARYYRQFGGARRILDVGCGTGAFGRLRPSDDIDVYGIDADALAIEQAARFERTLLANVEHAPLPFPDDFFDGVLAKDIFEHVEHPGRLASEIYRITRSGGVIVASVVVARPKRVWDDYTHVRGFTQRSARMLIEDAGFRVEDTWRMGGVPLSNRFGFIDLVPLLLRVPVLDALWGSSWELRARK